MATIPSMRLNALSAILTVVEAPLPLPQPRYLHITLLPVNNVTWLLIYTLVLVTVIALSVTTVLPRLVMWSRLTASFATPLPGPDPVI